MQKVKQENQEQFDIIAIQKSLAELTPQNREQTLKQLRLFVLQKKIGYDEYRVVWKGLYYALWLADKVTNQIALSEEIAKLVVHISFKKSHKYLAAWVRAYLNIMNKEWFSIDYHRMNKFLKLARFQFAQILKVFELRNYNESVIQEVNKVLKEELGCTKTVNGLTLHFLQIFVELVNDIEHGLDSQQTKNVFGSITDILASTDNDQLMQHIQEFVIMKCVEMRLRGQLRKISLDGFEEDLFKHARSRETGQSNRKYLYDAVEQLKKIKELEQPEEEGAAQEDIDEIGSEADENQIEEEPNNNNEGNPNSAPSQQQLSEEALEANKQNSEGNGETQPLKKKKQKKKKLNQKRRAKVQLEKELQKKIKSNESATEEDNIVADDFHDFEVAIEKNRNKKQKSSSKQLLRSKVEQDDSDSDRNAGQLVKKDQRGQNGKLEEVKNDSNNGEHYTDQIQASDQEEGEDERANEAQEEEEEEDEDQDQDQDEEEDDDDDDDDEDHLQIVHDEEDSRDDYEQMLDKRQQIQKRKSAQILQKNQEGEEDGDWEDDEDEDQDYELGAKVGDSDDEANDDEDDDEDYVPVSLNIQELLNDPNFKPSFPIHLLMNPKQKKDHFKKINAEYFLRLQKEKLPLKTKDERKKVQFNIKSNQSIVIVAENQTYKNQLLQAFFQQQQQHFRINNAKKKVFGKKF